MLEPVPVEAVSLIAAALTKLPFDEMLIAAAAPVLEMVLALAVFTPVLVVVATLPNILILPVALSGPLKLMALV